MEAAGASEIERRGREALANPDDDVAWGDVMITDGIDSASSVCGGSATIVRTRIPVWVLEQARRLRMSEAELLRLYPGLHAEDLANAWAYMRSHREEIEREIVENEAA